MAIQSIPRTGGAAEIGSLIGGGIGSALSEGIQALAESKLNAMQEQKAARDLRNAFPNLSYEEALFISKQPPKERIALLLQYSSGLSGLNQQKQQQQMQQEQGLQALLGQQQKPQFPYRPEFTGAKQPEYGGREQQELSQQIQQAQQQLQAIKKPASLSESLGHKGAEESKMALAQQKQAYTSTDKFLKTARPEKLVAEELKAPTQRLLKWLRNGKKKDTGFIKNYIASGSFASGLTTEEQNAARDMKKLVIGSAKMGKGLPTTARLKLEEGAKINFGNTPEAMEAGLVDLMHFIEQASYPYDHATELIKANQGKPIEGLESIVNQDYNAKFGENIEEYKPHRKVLEEFDKLPDASKYPEKSLEMPDGSIRRSNGKEWVK